MTTGQRLGTLCGLLLLVVVGQCVFFLAVSTATLLASGTMTSGTVTQNLKRQLQKVDEEDDEFDDGSWAAWGFTINILALLAVCIVFPLVSFIGAWTYWKLYISPTHDRYLMPGMIMPQELTGRFKYDLFDCTGAIGMFCCTCFCSFFAIGDLWYRAGYSHAISGNTAPQRENCPGWQFFLGCCGCCILAEGLDCCAPFAFAALTSGLGWMNQEGGGRSGMGSIIPFRERFGIPSSCNSFCEDCCLWCWCLPCQATREWQQINDALKQWPLPMPAAPPSMVVGQPVFIQASDITAEPMADPKASRNANAEAAELPHSAAAT